MGGLNSHLCGPALGLATSRASQHVVNVWYQVLCECWGTMTTEQTSPLTPRCSRSSDRQTLTKRWHSMEPLLPTADLRG